MDSDTAFGQFGRAIETDPIDILLAKWRRDRMVRALLARRDAVAAVIEAGSQARETTVGPIHDIDLVVVLKPGWLPVSPSEPGSADKALEALGALLQQTHLVQKWEPRNHVVKCEMGIAADYVPFFSGGLAAAPPVDVMPAYQVGSGLGLLNPLLVPERRNDRWVTVDPELLIDLVEQRQREWQYFKPVMRMVKAWAAEQGLDVKSAVIEALVLKFMPLPGLFDTMSYGEALAGFFKAASEAHVDFLTAWWLPVDVQMNLSVLQFIDLRAALAKAAGLSRQAMDAENGVGPGSAIAYWHELFGDAFPAEGLFDWLLAAPPVAAHDRGPGQSWLDWLLRFFERRPRPANPAPAIPSPDDPLTPASASWPPNEPGPSSFDPPPEPPFPGPAQGGDYPGAPGTSQRPGPRQPSAPAAAAGPGAGWDGVFDEDRPQRPVRFGRGQAASEPHG